MSPQVGLSPCCAKPVKIRSRPSFRFLCPCGEHIEGEDVVDPSPMWLGMICRQIRGQSSE